MFLVLVFFISIPLMINSFNSFPNTFVLFYLGEFFTILWIIVSLLMFSCPYHPTELFVIFFDVISSEVGIFLMFFSQP